MNFSKDELDIIKEALLCARTDCLYDIKLGCVVSDYKQYKAELYEKVYNKIKEGV